MGKNFLIFAFCAGLMSGCSKKDKPAEVSGDAGQPVTQVTTDSEGGTKPIQQQAAPEQDVLPGATDVRNALARKDYTGAVERLQILKGIASNDQLWIAYRELSGEVGITLAEAAKTDAKAQQALGTYRLMMYGR